MLLSTWPSLLIFAALWGVFYLIAKLSDAGGAPADPFAGCHCGGGCGKL